MALGVFFPAMGYQFQGIQWVEKALVSKIFSVIPFLQYKLPHRKCRNPSGGVQSKIKVNN